MIFFDVGEFPPPIKEEIVVVYEGRIGIGQFYADRYDAIGWLVQLYGEDLKVVPFGAIKYWQGGDNKYPQYTPEDIHYDLSEKD